MFCVISSCASGGRAVRDFFFSSRRRHTRYIGDWSSDVCSSDLNRPCRAHPSPKAAARGGPKFFPRSHKARSEERRVGKECRSRGFAVHYKQKEDQEANTVSEACASMRVKTATHTEDRVSDTKLY